MDVRSDKIIEIVQAMTDDEKSLVSTLIPTNILFEELESRMASMEAAMIKIKDTIDGK